MDNEPTTVDTTITGTFAKLDDEQHVAFGWAYVAKDGGQVSLDHSGDYVDDTALPDFERAVYDYVLTSREGDEMHVRTSGVAKLVETVFITPAKLSAMGLVSKAVDEGHRVGWWVGFKVLDPGVWAKVKDGTYRAFSIAGTGVREDV